MARLSSPLQKTIALVRILTALIFILFGQYKLFTPSFAHGGFEQYVSGFVQSQAVGFYKAFLAAVVLPHPVLFGYLVGVLELAIGLCLLIGLFVRAASVLGALHMLSLTLATWWGPGHDAPLWQYFGAELDHLPLLFLFLIFFMADSGQTWGLDGRR
jgi:uncharacterized membrane protein YphA (DoxX/SURF4 family)